MIPFNFNLFYYIVLTIMPLSFLDFNEANEKIELQNQEMRKNLGVCPGNGEDD